MVLFIVAPTWKYLSINRMNKLIVYIHLAECYGAKQMNKLPLHRILYIA